jgi:hypothetical protein
MAKKHAERAFFVPKGFRAMLTKSLVIFDCAQTRAYAGFDPELCSRHQSIAKKSAQRAL